MTNADMTFDVYDDSCGNDVVINDDVFRMNELLFQGSDSQIFIAHSLKDDEAPAVVIKCLACRKDSEVWRRTMREIESGIMLRKCPYVVRSQGYSVLKGRGAGEDYYRIFLLFDRLQCLDDLKTADVRTALGMCRDVSLALECMRKHGLVHSDVKPQNIYCDGEKWLLGDFGSVCLSGGIAQYGSEGYLSPEVFRGEPCDIRADIYSLGITLYKLVSGGRLPFCSLPCDTMSEDDVYLAIMKRMKGEVIPPLKGVSEKVNALLSKMCRFERSERYKKPLLVAKEAEKLLSEIN